ncbi:hypothetical protein D9C73_025058 [Collichthys lucidus]|uniref:Uncharacterized protein n=1 Tax=Collichthys lucidus TaxID=240159 RepID=A0A4U5VU84_COLLU|nr:hypothetical protein D9C73_025058 [Collichthys lucidus]
MGCNLCTLQKREEHYKLLYEIAQQSVPRLSFLLWHTQHYRFQKCFRSVLFPTVLHNRTTPAPYTSGKLKDADTPLYLNGYLCSHSCAILTGLLAARPQLPSGHREIYGSRQTIYIQRFICDLCVSDSDNDRKLVTLYVDGLSDSLCVSGCLQSGMWGAITKSGEDWSGDEAMGACMMHTATLQR